MKKKEDKEKKRSRQGRMGWGRVKWQGKWKESGEGEKEEEKISA